MWILLTVVSTVVVIILIFVVRTKCQLNRTQVGISKMCVSKQKHMKGRTRHSLGREVCLSMN